jgi:tRNA-dihydrouridine synthase B
MQSGFWKKLAKPIIGLSPMDGVTDQPFRHLAKKYGHVDLIYTEFATVEGFCRGVKQPLTDFLYDETQRPIVAQIYGKTPDFFRQTAIAICQLGFDGVDINMGCPAKSVSQGGAGAGLIKTPELAKEIILATQKGVEEWKSGKTVRDCPDLKDKICKVIEDRQEKLPKEYQKHDREIPVSVKTRVGYDKPITKEWIEAILDTNPAAIALHGRTLRQGYSGLASWDEIKLAGETIKKHNPEIVFLGNGDTNNYSEALKKIKKYDVDGVLIGRATFGNPWVLREDGQEGDISDRAKLALEHAKLWEKSYQDREKYRFFPMRKHLAWYIKSFPNASEIRSELVRTDNSEEVEEILKKHNLLI